MADDIADKAAQAASGAVQSVFVQNMSVKRSSHAALTNVHRGSVAYPSNSWQVIDPATVPGPAKLLLDKSTATAGMKCYFFESTDLSMIPSHFAAAVPENIKDFTNINIFFHPNPGMADPPMLPQDYPDQGSWASLYRYAPIIGCQIAEAKKDQVFVMPYVPERMFGTTGDFAKKWKTIVLDIARLIKLDITNNLDLVMDVKKVVVSSFSFGIKASDGFRTQASSSLTGLLAEIWDLDGAHSTSGQISISLRNKQLPRLIQYQQTLPTLSNSFFVGPLRWAKIDPAMPAAFKKNEKLARKATHGNIGKALWYHAATLSKIG